MTNHTLSHATIMARKNELEKEGLFQADVSARRETKTVRKNLWFTPTAAGFIDQIKDRDGLSENDAAARALEKEAKKIPLYGEIPCGEMAETAHNTIEDYFNVGDFYAVREGDFLLRARGDSMTGDGVQDGDLVLIRPQSTCDSGDTAAVLIDSPMGVRATLKKVQYTTGSPIIKLIPMNPDHPTIEIDTSKEKLLICGVKRGVIRVH